MLHFYEMCTFLIFFFIARLSNGLVFLAIVSKRIIACLLAAAFSQGKTELNAKHKHRKGRDTAHFAFAIGKTGNVLMKWILMYANGPLSQQFFAVLLWTREQWISAFSGGSDQATIFSITHIPFWPITLSRCLFHRSVQYLSVCLFDYLCFKGMYSCTKMVESFKHYKTNQKLFHQDMVHCKSRVCLIYCPSKQAITEMEGAKHLAQRVSSSKWRTTNIMRSILTFEGNLRKCKFIYAVCFMMCYSIYYNNMLTSYDLVRRH